MFRKTMIALSATAALTAVSLSPTAASAHSWHGGWHGYGPGVALGVGVGLGLLAATTYQPPRECYITQRVIRTPYGQRLRDVEVCD